MNWIEHHLRLLEKFLMGIIEIFGEEYLRRPSEDDIACLLAIADHHDFCCNIGKFRLHALEIERLSNTAWLVSSKKPVLVVETIASGDTWIWHAFFGIPSTTNDIAIVNRSPLFKELYAGTALRCEYMVNNNKYDMGSYLTEGIYPK